MKATLLALMTLGSLAMAEDVVTLSSPSPSNTQAGYTSFDFQLDDSWLTKDPEATVLTEMVKLTSMEVSTAKTWYNKNQTQRNQGAGVAIYQKSDTVWSFVGSSDWQKGYGEGAVLTFSFGDDFVLSSGTTYTAVFYGNETAFNGLTTGATLESLVGGENPSEDSPLAAFGMKSINYTQVPNFSMYSNTGAAQNQAPFVTFKVQNQNVPEPTTGTLSLLALAGLCIRRRK